MPTSTRTVHVLRLNVTFSSSVTHIAEAKSEMDICCLNMGDGKSQAYDSVRVRDQKRNVTPIVEEIHSLLVKVTTF